ncbi:STAS domain-containing protein [Noviherbaspirillum sp. ST9]|uniref:STAS domain-containing protein n=1 Tax=Noviherbaspirillum sp. ST9 TaxID=3401606 RepID=UPI003B585E30
MDSADQRKGALLRLEGEMSIYKAAELKQTLLAAVPAAGTLEADLSGVTEMDTAGLQLLMLVKKTAQERGVDLKLVNHSPAVVDVFELLNLGTFFGDPLVIPPRSANPNPSAR